MVGHQSPDWVTESAVVLAQVEADCAQDDIGDGLVAFVSSGAQCVPQLIRDSHRPSRCGWLVRHASIVTPGVTHRITRSGR